MFQAAQTQAYSVIERTFQAWCVSSLLHNQNNKVTNEMFGTYHLQLDMSEMIIDNIISINNSSH